MVMDRESFINKSIGLLGFGCLLFVGCTTQPQRKTDKKRKKYMVLARSCDGCGKCFRACNEKAIYSDGRIAVIDQAKCKGCGDCQQYCRKMAIIPAEKN